MITPLLHTALAPLVHQRRRVIALGTAAALCGLVGIAAWLGRPPFGVFLLLEALALAAAASVARRWKPDYRELARRIEARHPELQHALQTAVEQVPQGGKLSFLQAHLLAETLAACRKNGVLEETGRGQLAAALLALALAGWGTLMVGRELSRPGATAPVANGTVPGVVVAPGDVEIEHGTGLMVTATFPSEVPGEVVMVMQEAGATPRRVALARNLGDPVFGTLLADVRTSFTYRVEYDEQATRSYAVEVFQWPRVERADVTVRPPAYTKLPARTFPDARRVSAVEGSTIEVIFHLNKPVQSATLLARDGRPLPLVLEGNTARLPSFTVEKSALWEVQLRDTKGRGEKVPMTLALEALPNRKPELKRLLPRGDSRVSALEEVDFKAEVWDDFGLLAAGIHYTVAGREPVDLRLSEASGADEKVELAHRLALENLGVQPGELLSWHMWAEDLGPDGKLRRTQSDLFFAEVRPFEEIFRQGESQQGQGPQSQAGQQAQKLAELQKQILTATWNLQRKAADAPQPTEEHRKATGVVRDSQQEALRMAGQAEGQTQDELSRAHLEAAQQAMQEARKALDQAVEKTAALEQALAAEQAAYQALLKMATNEYTITRNNQRSQASGESRSQSMEQQLDQLELKEESQRYETQTEAETPEQAAQREEIAALNQLKELAKRQEDINEKLKELQTALQTEQTDTEREERERELKRLEQEQREMLADMDEMREKMASSPEASRFSKERKQLDQTRAQSQRTSEAMQQGDVQKALASGTRAQRELQEINEQLRQRTGRQFSEAMREMRSEAREMADRQAAIAEQLAAEENKALRRSLDAETPEQGAVKALEAQQRAYEKLEEKMRRVSEQAEAAEPILARELYDTLRKAAQGETAKALDFTRQLAERGYQEQARELERRARGQIEEMKEGIERAGEQILGDEAEALRRAKTDLEALHKALDREIAQRDGPAPGEAQPASEPNASGEPQPGQLGEPSQTSTPGEDQPGTPTQNEARSAQATSDPGEPVQAQSRASGSQPSPAPRRGSQRGGNSEGTGSQGGAIDGEQAGPLTGGRFLEWSDRLRNVEEMLDDPILRNEAARVREIARGMRSEFKRHSVEPKWDMVRSQIRAPLAQLRDRVAEKLARKEGKNALVPLDRDPVPAKFSGQVQKYYEELGRE